MVERQTQPRRVTDRSGALDDLGRSFRNVVRSLNRLRGRETHLGPKGLSRAQFELLIELDEHGALTAGGLAQAAQLTPGTVTQMLDHLVISGYVQRSRLDTDRRLVLCQLTPAGKEQVQSKRASWRKRWEDGLSRSSAAELRVAARVLDELNVVFQDALGEDDQGSEEACR